ncbi:MBL fold metallo-hydrolase [Cellulomonas sp. HZM]|uniref:MBL fold metallo-hydrolase n=1 Tax=Cellulomonas sp. HZM TaxID=1454010 RepID=UPI00049321BD|nr:MBL fold metallo-hydrolase [Cellulomonas sp. HZM]
MTTTTDDVLTTATFVGGPTIAFTYAGRTFLTDPTFDQPGDYDNGVTLRKLVGPALQPEALGPIDVVLLSHDQHADNLDHAGRDVLARVPVVLSTPDAAARITGVRGLEPWEQVDLGDVVVTAVPARHGPEGAEALTGHVTGFVLEATGEPTVYVSGDNASIDVVAAIARRFGGIELALLFVGGADVGRFPDEPLTLDAARASAVADLLVEAVVVPVHHSDWAHFVDPVSAVVDRFARAGRADRLVVVPRGVPTEVRGRRRLT